MPVQFQGCPGPCDSYQTCKSPNTHACRHTHIHRETSTRSIFIVFGSAAVYVLPSLSATHPALEKQKSILSTSQCHHNYSFETAIENALHLHCVFIRLHWVSNAYRLGRVSLQPSEPPSRFTVCCRLLLMTGLSEHVCVL